MCTKNHNNMRYSFWDTEWDRQIFLSFWVIFCCCFTFALMILKIKMPGDISLLHMCTINEDHMIYASWNIRHDRQTFSSIWAILCLFTPLTIQKIKILKKYREELSFYTCILNYNHMMYGSWAMECEGQTFLSFWTIFCSFTNNPKNENFEKMKKTPGDIIILHKCTMNNNHMMHGSCDMKRDRQNFLSFWDIFCPFTWRYHHFT